MATTAPKIALGGLARRLVSDGFLSEEAAQEAFQKARAKNKSFIRYITSEKLISTAEVAHAAAHEFAVPLLDIDTIELDPSLLELVKLDLIKKYNVLPLFKRGKKLFIATSDPTNFHALDDIKFQVNLITEPVMVDEEKLLKILEKTIESLEAPPPSEEGEDGGFGEVEETADNDKSMASEASMEICR